MKKLLLSSLIVISALSLSAQQFTKSFTHGGQTRSYIVYLPTNYTAGAKMPVVIALHGLGDTMGNFSGVGFHQMGDTADFITVTPQAVVETFITQASCWNAGTFLNSSIDDVGFISALIDTLNSNYSIDTNRVYATGFSMGGMMSQRLAAELSDRIAAVASVSGQLTTGVAGGFNPTRPVPVMHMHGTNDATINWQGQFNNQVTLCVSVDSTLNMWRTNNGCTSPAVEDSLPNTKNDGLTIETYTNDQCDNSTEVLLYKIDNGTHTWLMPNNDVYATAEIWKFFSRHQWQPAPIGITENPIKKAIFKAYPVPFSNELTLELNEPVDAIRLYNVLGQIEMQLHTTGMHHIEINTANLSPGIYFISADSKEALKVTK